MRFLYFDNFRGFESSFIPLKEVNFFVGENSTGKTSVLKLIGILSSSDFWRYNEFGKGETSLGGFSEIVTSSKNGPSKSFFEIGFFKNGETENENLSIKIKFIEKNNYPFVKEICFRKSSFNIQAVVDGTFLKYRYSKDQVSKEVANENQLENFKSWIHDNGLAALSFFKVELDDFGIIPILFQVKSLIAYRMRYDKKSEDDIRNLDITLPSFFNTFAWIAPVRAEPLPTYQYKGLRFNHEGKHSLSVLKEILPGPDVKKILNRFGTDSGLYDDIKITDLSDDQFQVHVYINGESRNMPNVGYGVSQILPIIIEAIARPNNSWFAIQQPELHLHPKAQAALGDFFFKSNQLDEQKLIIETHSDYTIDRYRLRINRAFKEKKTNALDISQVVFFQKEQANNSLEIIDILEDGSYPEEQPKAFREFFIKEQLQLITI